MFPFALPAWESDATLHAGLQQSVASNITGAGQAAALSGGEAAFDARTVSPAAAYSVYLHGLYARLLNISVEGGFDAPANNYSLDFASNGGWLVGRDTRLLLSTHDYIANRLGIRAFDDLAQRDPFLVNQVEYAVGGDAQVNTLLTRRLNLQLHGGYIQQGAAQADLQEVKGVDLHLATGDMTFNYELGKNDILSPEVLYQYAHYYHALLDVDLDRGPADIHAVSGVMGLQHTFARRMTGTFALGVTGATAPPLIADQKVVIAPLVRLALRYDDHTFHVEGSYQYEYASLGPGLGYGQQHAAILDVSLRPVDGRKWRDLVLHGIGRFSYGRSDVAAAPPEQLMGPPPTGTLTTWEGAGGALLEYPIMRGLSLTGSLDIEYSQGVFDPVPVTGQSGAGVVSVATIGLMGVLSTDKRMTVKPDPQEEQDERHKDPFAKSDDDNDHLGAADEKPAATLGDEILAPDPENDRAVDQDTPTVPPARGDQPSLPPPAAPPVEPPVAPVAPPVAPQVTPPSSPSPPQVPTPPKTP